MVVGIFPESAQFTLESLDPPDIARVVSFAYDVAKRVSQAVYVLAFEINGRSVGDRFLEDSERKQLVYLGREDAANIDWFGVGNDIVVWRPHSEEWACDLIQQNWWEQRQVCWAVLVDGRDTENVGHDLQQTWPRGYAKGDLHDLIDTVAPERGLAMLSYDGSFFSGKAFSESWQTAFDLLKEISAAKLKIWDNEMMDTAERMASGFASSRGLSAREKWTPAHDGHEVRWRNGTLEKVIEVWSSFHAGVLVEARARERWRPWVPRPRRWTWRRIGTADRAHGEVERRLGELLEAAWEWLSKVDAGAVEADYARMIAHVSDNIDPFLERFAAGCAGGVRRRSWWRRRIVWPRRSPAFRLDVRCSPRSGIDLAGYRRAEELSLWPTWEHCPGLLSDLTIHDWLRLDDISSRLEEARRRMEAEFAKPRRRPH